MGTASQYYIFLFSFLKYYIVYILDLPKKFNSKPCAYIFIVRAGGQSL